MPIFYVTDILHVLTLHAFLSSSIQLRFHNLNYLLYQLFLCHVLFLNIFMSHDKHGRGTPVMVFYILPKYLLRTLYIGNQNYCQSVKSLRQIVFMFSLLIFFYYCKQIKNKYSTAIST